MQISIGYSRIMNTSMFGGHFWRQAGRVGSDPAYDYQVSVLTPRAFHERSVISLINQNKCMICFQRQASQTSEVGLNMSKRSETLHRQLAPAVTRFFCRRLNPP
jgi:hypothetical protein